MLWNKVASFIAVLAAGSSLVACSTPGPVRVQYVTQTIPDALLECETAPSVPGAEATQRDVAVYLVKLHSAYLNCKGRLSAVKGIMNDPSP